MSPTYMSSSYFVARSSSIVARLRTPTRPCLRLSKITCLPLAYTRTYASKKAKDKSKEGKHSPILSTQDLVPGSQRIAAGEEYTKAEGKMKAILEKYRKDVAGMEMRASGRVTPAVLSPVRVMLPDNKGADGKGVRLDDIATVGVREGTTLIVTVFEEHTLKHVESSIFDAKLPGVIPQKLDTRTIKIPMPKPTVDARHAMYTTAQRQAEDARVQIRRQHQASLKKGKYQKHSPEIEEVRPFGYVRTV
ncbi:hypothetical protein AcW1_001613 [Taiwanofungus camphoratus]|nr:hypothetical protein AcV7_003537 [Antrodia cinnamomea]KAI0938731.1 hypothetical protein AcV5_000345 [Antrodia cinnamomea]KAI0945376.1 hypothetical protein AcW1_001613 [Antrodia cinnamomea]